VPHSLFGQPCGYFSSWTVTRGHPSFFPLWSSPPRLGVLHKPSKMGEGLQANFPVPPSSYPFPVLACSPFDPLRRLRSPILPPWWVKKRRCIRIYSFEETGPSLSPPFHPGLPPPWANRFPFFWLSLTASTKPLEKCGPDCNRCGGITISAVLPFGPFFFICFGDFYFPVVFLSPSPSTKQVDLIIYGRADAIQVRVSFLHYDVHSGVVFEGLLPFFNQISPGRRMCFLTDGAVRCLEVSFLGRWRPPAAALRAGCKVFDIPPLFSYRYPFGAS